MHNPKILVVTVLALVLSACVYVPVVDRQGESSNCKTLTQSMSLDKIEMRSNVTYGCHEGGCLAAMLATATVVSAGSAIISGSIVLTGNTIHWLEYQGTCSDGYLGKTKQLFLDSINKFKSAPAEERKPNPAGSKDGATGLPQS